MIKIKCQVVAIFLEYLFIRVSDHNNYSSIHLHECKQNVSGSCLIVDISLVSEWQQTFIWD